MSSSIMPDENNQPIHLEWKGKVYVKRKELSEETNHIEAYKVRHRYTNYDQLINSIELQRLEPLERSRTVAINKFECTSQAHQFRNGIIREQFIEAKKQSAKLAADVVRHKGLLGAIQKILWGNEKEIKSLKASLAEKEIEIKSLKEQVEEEKVDNEYQKEIAIWKKKFEKEEQRRIELGQKNRSLGGQVSHAKRNKVKLDSARDELTETKASNLQLSKDLEIAKRELTELKVLKRKYEEEIRRLKGNQNG